LAPKGAFEEPDDPFARVTMQLTASVSVAQLRIPARTPARSEFRAGKNYAIGEELREPQGELGTELAPVPGFWFGQSGAIAANLL
jgi:hypothetical protein